MRVLCLFVALIVMSGSVPMSAHHSPTMFDMTKSIEMKGEVRRFEWKNPHSYIQLLVKDETGKEVEWSLEMGAFVYLMNSGLTPSTVKPGQTLTVTVSPLKSGKNGGLVLRIVTPDGRKFGAGRL